VNKKRKEKLFLILEERGPAEDPAATLGTPGNTSKCPAGLWTMDQQQVSDASLQYK